MLSRSRSLQLTTLPLINSADPSFELELHRRRAFLVHDPKITGSKAPNDLDDLEAALNASRSSPEPDEHYLVSFQRRLRNSCNEAAVVQAVMPKLVPIDQLLDREDVITVPNQQWDKECALPRPASAQYRIPLPKPDQTIGLAASNFHAYENALAHLSHSARPARSLSNLTFPLLTVEAKGDTGHNVCRLQNLHNAAVMLHQLLRLWQDTDAEDEFFGQAMVCTISITTQTCAICHYWMEREDGNISVRGRLYKSWSLSLNESMHLGSIVRDVRNTIEHTITRGKRLIHQRLSALELRLSSLSTPSTTSTSSTSGSSCSRKRRFIFIDEAYDDDGYTSPTDFQSSPSRKIARGRDRRPGKSVTSRRRTSW
ncbi:hypothetical protein BT63DRAFT_230794 [Microthyrium microscopicum]|uniref:DUF7924 domain-containing protein n=1 Tax=Microthyrium microscopicum TaxID=703497 RepID=A0A6A6UGY4_9PEZI|nr:hypothetical protein BT63DRAFT_230794 [Microthyrium microscopicum]